MRHAKTALCRGLATLLIAGTTLAQALAASPGAEDPRAASPYTEREVTFSSGDVEIAGTLTVPEGRGPFPAAVLITGSGPQDRDETVFGHRPFLVLADHLTRRGIAVLRCDDRGVGASSGSILAATTADFAADALAGLRTLQSDDLIADDRIGLIGHSEGALAAAMAAARSDEVAFVVMLSGPGVPFTELLPRQIESIERAAGTSEDAVAAQVALARETLAIVAADLDETTRNARLDDIVRREFALLPADQQPPAAALDDAVAAKVAVYACAWSRAIGSFDPATYLARIEVPVLAIHGTLDLQVDPQQNVPRIRAALARAENDDTEVLILPGLNHLLQTATTGSPAEYAQIAETMAPIVLETITDWIATRFLEKD